CVAVRSRNECPSSSPSGLAHRCPNDLLGQNSLDCASPECQSVLSAKCLTEHSSMSSEYPGGRNELSQSSPKRVLTAFRSRQTETKRKTSSSSETLFPKKCP